MAELLDLEGPERVLEVGTGSGYAAVVLFSGCAPTWSPWSATPPWRGRRPRRWPRLGYGNVEVRHGDGARGVPYWAPFDAISVTATANDEPPRVAARPSRARGADRAAAESAMGGSCSWRIRGTEVETVTAVRFVPLVGGTED